MDTTVDVSVFKVRPRDRADRKTKSYEVRWQLAGQKPRSKTFKLKGQASTFHAQLLTAAKNGSPFDLVTGLPANQSASATPSAYDVAVLVMAQKRGAAAAKTRKSDAEALSHATVALIDPRHQLSLERREELYQAMYQAFRLGQDSVSAKERDALRWLQKHTQPVGTITVKDARRALKAFETNLDGSPAGLNTWKRRRSGLSKIVTLAVEESYLATSPLTGLKPPATLRGDDEVNATDIGDPWDPPRILAVLRTLGRRGAAYAAFCAVLFYAGLRPGEAAGLTVARCHLPEMGWGELRLTRSTPRAGTAWTDSGEARDDRGLKHRGQGAERRVPIPPVLVAILLAHLAAEGIRSGLLFRTATGKPIGEAELLTRWKEARDVVHPLDADDPNAPRPLGRLYDLRHAAASLWLNEGVPIITVAHRLGHSPAMTLTIYGHLVRSDEARWNAAIEVALDRAERRLRGEDDEEGEAAA